MLSKRWAGYKRENKGMGQVEGQRQISITPKVHVPNNLFLGPTDAPLSFSSSNLAEEPFAS